MSDDVLYKTIYKQVGNKPGIVHVKQPAGVSAAKFQEMVVAVVEDIGLEVEFLKPISMGTGTVQ